MAISVGGPPTICDPSGVAIPGPLYGDIPISGLVDGIALSGRFSNLSPTVGVAEASKLLTRRFVALTLQHMGSVDS